jgi:hypothetical protein
MRVVVVSACVPQPWANGGGTTRDLAIGAVGPAGAPGVPVGPARAPGPAFDWRLSLADIDRDGPFSRLPGVDRVFALVDGAVALAFDDAGGASVPCDADTDPFAFVGEHAPHASLPRGASARALNLMLARGRRAGAMRRVRLPDGATLDAAWSHGADVRACYVVAGRLALGGATVEAGTLVELRDGDPAPVAAGPARLLEVAIRPAAGPGPRSDSRIP